MRNARPSSSLPPAVNVPGSSILQSQASNLSPWPGRRKLSRPTSTVMCSRVIATPAIGLVLLAFGGGSIVGGCAGGDVTPGGSSGAAGSSTSTGGAMTTGHGGAGGVAGGEAGGDGG